MAQIVVRLSGVFCLRMCVQIRDLTVYKCQSSRLVVDDTVGFDCILSGYLPVCLLITGTEVLVFPVTTADLPVSPSTSVSFVSHLLMLS